jgi:hypothetical protein
MPEKSPLTTFWLVGIIFCKNSEAFLNDVLSKLIWN